MSFQLFIGALMIVGTAWFSKGSEANTWLYVFSVWMILFSAFQVYGIGAAHKVSKLALALLVGASVIIIVTWWANGAENMWVFLTCVVGMLVSFFAIISQKKQGNDQ